MKYLLLPLLILMLAVPASVLAIDPPAGKSKPFSESDFYRIVTLPTPENVALEIGGMAVMPDGRLAVCTRRGEVWLIANPYMANGGAPHYKLFAQGLHEPLGLLYKDGSLYTAQRGELTRLSDKNGDDKADLYECIAKWPLSGNYHEYNYGPLLMPDGSMMVTTNVGFFNPEWWIGQAQVPWRGWALNINTEGKIQPYAAGMRSPCGIGMGPDGEFFYGDNQGDWIGSGFIAHVEKGDFVGGNPASLRWASLPESPVKLRTENIVSSDQPQYELANKQKGFKLPAVWLPHSILGISTAGILSQVEAQGAVPGTFGPFEGQMFVGDQGQSKIMRVALEKVNGQYQGAAFMFREGFASGVLRLAWGKDGSMFVGQTNRGWGSTGNKPFALERVEWTGKMPFEMKTIKAMPDGFEIEFTQAVDKASAAALAAYKITSFNYKYHSQYGSPIINKENCPIRGVKVSEDGMKARIVVDGMRQYYIHEVIVEVKNKEGHPLLHNTGYYTLNNIPQGDKLDIPLAEVSSTHSSHTGDHSMHNTPVSSGAEKVSAKRTLQIPASWGKPDAILTLGTRPGLKYDTELIEVKAGSKLQLVFNNPDDMPHNIVVTMPGKANEVGTLAMKLGVDGPEMQYVPASDLVLYHSGMVQPGQQETIYFTAPDTPGDYMYVCTYPGHAFIMQGILRVVQ
jgi:azurin